jgi:hypothetical protein
MDSDTAADNLNNVLLLLLVDLASRRLYKAFDATRRVLAMFCTITAKLIETRSPVTRCRALPLPDVLNLF